MVCNRRTPKHCCDECTLPEVTITTAGSDAAYVVADADTATITVDCGSSPITTTPLTLTSGGISDTYVTGGSVCFISITATNNCGTTTRTWRNYTTPKLCDCINTDLDPPTLWDRAGTIVTTITGSTTAASLVISGSTICTTPSPCGDITGSFVKTCGTGTKRYLITTATGCSDYHYYIDLLDLSAWTNYPASPYYLSRMVMSSGWFQKGSNPYPTLTSVTVGTNLATLLGVGSFNPRSSRDVVLRYDSSANFAPSLAMLKCYLGTLNGVGGNFSNSYDINTNPGPSNQGHCEFSGISITAEVI